MHEARCVLRQVCNAGTQAPLLEPLAPEKARPDYDESPELVGPGTDEMPPLVEVLPAGQRGDCYQSMR